MLANQSPPTFPEMVTDPERTHDPNRDSQCPVMGVLGVDISIVEEDFSPSEIKS